MGGVETTKDLQMNPALRRRFEAVRKLLNDATCNEVRTRHKVGVIILEIRDAADKYGAQAVATLATALGRDATTLYKYAHVAACWDAEAMDRLLQRRSPAGDLVSWSHLVELAALEKPRQRALLLERVFQEGLSVRALAALVRGTRTCRRSDGRR